MIRVPLRRSGPVHEPAAKEQYSSIKRGGLYRKRELPGWWPGLAGAPHKIGGDQPAKEHDLADHEYEHPKNSMGDAKALAGPVRIGLDGICAQVTQGDRIPGYYLLSDFT